MKATCKMYGNDDETELELELYKRGYIKAPSWDKRCFVVFDCETLEQVGSGANGVEAQLSLVSVAVCDTMTRKPWYNCIDDDDDERDTRCKFDLGMKV